MVDRIKGGAQVERYQKGSRTSVSCMKHIIKSECKCSFGGVMWSIGRLKGVEIGTGVDVRK